MKKKHSKPRLPQLPKAIGLMYPGNINSVKKQSTKLEHPRKLPSLPNKNQPLNRKNTSSPHIKKTHLHTIAEKTENDNTNKILESKTPQPISVLKQTRNALKVLYKRELIASISQLSIKKKNGFKLSLSPTWLKVKKLLLNKDNKNEISDTKTTSSLFLTFESPLETIISHSWNEWITRVVFELSYILSQDINVKAHVYKPKCYQISKYLKYTEKINSLIELIEKKIGINSPKRIFGKFYAIIPIIYMFKTQKRINKIHCTMQNSHKR